jgi:hypothetical protein
MWTAEPWLSYLRPSPGTTTGGNAGWIHRRGGTIGYGLVVSAPNPELPKAQTLGWILGSAAVVGALASVSPRAFLRPGGRFRWIHEEDED